jgi:hypothetical protein
VIIGTTKEFRLMWLATQQNIFIIAGVIDRVDENIIASFSKAAMEYALEHYKGLPRGVQAAVACFPLLIAPSVDEKAKEWVMNRPRKHFAAFEMPCCFDASTNTLHYYRKTPIWGAIYYKSFRKIISRYFCT